MSNLTNSIAIISYLYLWAVRWLNQPSERANFLAGVPRDTVFWLNVVADT
ncbi:MAG: hypothetical protein LH628_13565 [Microcoleus sp. CAN_BIN18]|nr:hypothetical protein [Microcoleus sp. CAN_BIN18]